MSKDTIHLFNNLSIKGLVANGFVGSTGQALLSNGTGVYWGSGAGFTGSKGDKGEDGVFGGAAFDYTYSTNTTLVDPGDGGLKFNNTNLSVASLLVIHDNDDNAVSIYNYLQTIDDSTSTIKGHFTITEKANTANFSQFSIIGNHIESGNTFQLPVAYLAGATSQTNGLDIIITFARTGDRGDTGYTGSTGFTGSKGDIGFTGSRGATGFTGSQGYTGSKGDIGFTGSKGDIGFTGSQGFTGSASTVAGPIGYTGSQGVGFTGSQGTTGFVGSASTTAGPTGFTGSQGTGFTGSKGDTGFTGSQGIIGYTGSQGPIGYTGSFGNQTTFAGDSTNRADITTRVDSGFYEHDTVTTAEGWPLNNSSWMHMLATTHSNDANYFSMQFAADFYSNSPFYRSVNNNGATAWNRIALYDNAYSSNLKATIFYDNDNTGYYTDPNGNSVLSTLYMVGNLSMDPGGLIVGRTSASTDVNVANDTGSFSARGNTSTIASMSFHRAGAYAINMGLGTDNVFRIGGWSASNNAFQMDGSGNLTMLNNITAYSDIRLKKDIVKIDNALEKVGKLNGYTYTRTDTNTRQMGVIAQEVMEVIPEVVLGSEETNYSVAYGNMVGLLIEAIKEQQTHINRLQEQINSIQNNIG